MTGVRRWTGTPAERPVGDWAPGERPGSAAAPGVCGGVGPSGQASIELLAILPAAAVVALAAAQLLAAGLTAELAAHAAEAGAIALLREEDPRAAARDALPGWSRERVRVRVSGRSVRVRLAPPSLVPRLADALTASAHADAGPRP